MPSWSVGWLMRGGRHGCGRRHSAEHVDDIAPLAIDTTPQDFRFSNLGAGTYTLDIAGILKDVGGPLGYAHYSGSIQSVASAAPEPEALAMVLAGLTAVGLMARRRKQG